MNKLKFIFIAFLLCAFLSAGVYVAAASPAKSIGKKKRVESVFLDGKISAINGTDIQLSAMLRNVEKKPSRNIAVVTVHLNKAVLETGYVAVIQASNNKSKKESDIVDVSILKVGDRVAVAGIKRSDGSVDARSLRIFKALLNTFSR